MNKKGQPNYYAIIPATVRYDNNLKSAEILLYGEITALANKDGYCFAQNKYFADLYNVTVISVSRLKCKFYSSEKCSKIIFFWKLNLA